MLEGMKMAYHRNLQSKGENAMIDCCLGTSCMALGRNPNLSFRASVDHRGDQVIQTVYLLISL